jgi:Putative Ig domain
MRLRRLGLFCGLLVQVPMLLLTSCGGGGSNPPPPTMLNVTTSTLPTGTFGESYSPATLAASGGTAPYTWSIISGNLPNGMTLSTSGVVSGTPAQSSPPDTIETVMFTVQVKDSESTPGTGTGVIGLTVVQAQPPSITTTTLPAGVLNAAYGPATLAATSGVPPYTWSATGLPTGISLNASTGALSGAPTAVGSYNPAFTVTDSLQHSNSMNIGIIVNAAAASLPNGNYSFVFSGTDLVNGPIAINGTFSIQNGVIGGGFYDENANQSSPQIEQPIAGGSVTAYANGLGQFTLKLVDGSVTFALASPASISAAGNNSEIRIIEFDDTTGVGTRGSGVLKLANATSGTSAITGNYAFRFSGVDANNKQTAIAGSFQTDGAGNIKAGLADADDGGTLTSYTGVAGTYSVDANSRGTLTLKLTDTSGTTTYNYSFYQVSPAELLALSTDAASATVSVVSGSLLQQAATLNSATLNGVFLEELTGLAPVVGGNTGDITLGLVTANGSGTISVSYDEINPQLSSNTYSGTYAVDTTSPSGRVTIAVTAGSHVPPVFYLVNSAKAFVLGEDGSASSGILEAQASGPFSNTSFKGNYLGGTLPLSNPSQVNAAGLVTADGNGNVTILSNTSGPNGQLVTYDTTIGTYVADSSGSGRVVVTAPPAGTTRILYVVSPTRVVMLSSDGDGTLSSFEQ